MDQGIIQNLKVHYRGLVLRRYIAEVEAGTTSFYNISLLDATRYLVRAWDAVTPTTIANCFRKAGFRVDGTARDGTEGVAETDKTYEGLFERLRAFMRVPDDINFSDFATADEEVVARAARVARAPLPMKKLQLQRQIHRMSSMPIRLEPTCLTWKRRLRCPLHEMHLRRTGCWNK